jgi:hypothetical protein
MSAPSSARVLPFTILTQSSDRWQVDPALADRLREDAALIRAKPAEVIGVRNVEARQQPG